MQKILIIILIAFLGAVGFLSWKANNLEVNSPKAKVFNLILDNKTYKPDTVDVNLGDTVVFNIDNRDNENHGLHLPEFNVAEAIPPLQKTSVQFIANRTGATTSSCATDHPEKVIVNVVN